MARICITCSDYRAINLKNLLEPLGAMKNFVTPGECVLLKINLMSAKAPETAVTTHPSIVAAVANEVIGAGVQPYISDSPAELFTKRALAKV